MTPSCYVLLISAFCVASVICSNVTVSEKALIHDLLNNYRKVGVPGRPVKDHTHPVKVKMGIRLTKILDFDQENDKLTIAAWLILGWVDEYLQFDASSGIKRVFVPPSEIWIPDIYLFNAPMPMDELFDTHIRVSSDGSILWAPPYQIHSTCPSAQDAKEVTCELTFGSWVYNSAQLMLDPMDKTIDASFYNAHKEWELLKTNVKKMSKAYACCPGDVFDSLQYTMTLRKRKSKDDDKGTDKSAAHGTRSLWETIYIVSMTAILFDTSYRNFIMH